MVRVILTLFVKEIVWCIVLGLKIVLEMFTASVLMVVRALCCVNLKRVTSICTQVELGYVPLQPSLFLILKVLSLHTYPDY